MNRDLEGGASPSAMDAGTVGGLIVLGATAVGLFVVFAAMFPTFKLSENNCAATALIRGTDAPVLLVLVGCLLAGLAAGCATATAITALIRSSLGAGFASVAAQRVKSAADVNILAASLSPRFIGFWILCGLGAPLLLWGTTFDYHCVSPSGVLSRDGPWSPVKFYSWANVRSMNTRCHRDRYSSRSIYDLVMSDGKHLSLPIGGMRHASDPAFPMLAHALHGRAIDYDLSLLTRDDITKGGCGPVDWRAYVANPDKPAPTVLVSAVQP